MRNKKIFSAHIFPNPKSSEYKIISDRVFGCQPFETVCNFDCRPDVRLLPVGKSEFLTGPMHMHIQWYNQQGGRYILPTARVNSIFPNHPP